MLFLVFFFEKLPQLPKISNQLFLHVKFHLTPQGTSLHLIFILFIKLYTLTRFGSLLVTCRMKLLIILLGRYLCVVRICQFCDNLEKVVNFPDLCCLCKCCWCFLRSTFLVLIAREICVCVLMPCIERSFWHCQRLSFAKLCLRMIYVSESLSFWEVGFWYKYFCEDKNRMESMPCPMKMEAHC